MGSASTTWPHMGSSTSPSSSCCARASRESLPTMTYGSLYSRWFAQCPRGPSSLDGGRLDPTSPRNGGQVLEPWPLPFRGLGVAKVVALHPQWEPTTAILFSWPAVWWLPGVVGGTTTLGGHVGCALLVGCDHRPKGLGPDEDKGDLYLHRSLGPPLEYEAPPLVGVPRPNGPYNRVKGHHPWGWPRPTSDEGYGRLHTRSWREESPEAFSADHPPPTDGPLVDMVSCPPPITTDEVIFFMYRCSWCFSSLN
jgi:hypothetical protein